jgi:signal recognition particle receptor subunit beta/predicted  nucleic acid-binding Zn-ribbon protein
MVIYNAATRELTAKIVYYGPGLCGKTTNLKVLHDRLEPGTAGKLLNLQTQTDRTIYFDLLPVELGDIKGYKIRFQLATVPGQTAFNETRRVVLKGVDGIVFVADSQWTMLPKNLEAWQNLKDNLKSNDIAFESIPVVVQYNKRDLNDILAVDAMQEALGLSAYPFVEAVASAGRGVTETFKLISKLTFVDLLRRLQGRRAEEAGAAQASDEQARQDDLQSWKNSLLKRESQPSIPMQRASRPLSLVPPVSDEAPFDTSELARGVDDDEPSPYAVPVPPGVTPAPPPAADAGVSAETVQMEAIGDDLLSEVTAPEEDVEEAVEELVEPLSEADEIPVETAPEPETQPALLPAETAQDERIELLEQRLREADDRAGREREAAERLGEAVSSVQERVTAASAQLAALGERLAAVEQGVGGLHEALGSALQRFAPVESAAGRQHEVEAGLRGLEAGLRDLDERLRSEATRQRKDSDDVAMALRGLTERAQTMDQQLTSMTNRVGGHEEAMSGLHGVADRMPPLEDAISGLRGLADRMPPLEEHVAALSRFAEKLPELQMQVESVLRAHHELESTFEEKTQQGRREAEDIRSQIAPLLEDRVRRHESDALLFSEMERLRESLADSLHGLAERVRSAVREG